MSNIKSALRRILHGVQSAETVICVIGLIVTTLLTFAAVLNRYWLHISGMWFSNLSLFSFIFFMLLAVTVTTWQEGHVAVDFFRTKFLKGKPRSLAVHRLCLVALSIGFACAFLPASYKFMLRALKYPEYGTVVRWFNTSWLMVIPFIALVLLLVHLLVIAHKDIGGVIDAFRNKAGSEEHKWNSE